MIRVFAAYEVFMPSAREKCRRFYASFYDDAAMAHRSGDKRYRHASKAGRADSADVLTPSKEMLQIRNVRSRACVCDNMDVIKNVA